MGVSSYVAINAMSVGTKAEGAFVQPPDGEEQSVPLSADSREVDTSEKVAFCALQDGSYEAFDLGTKLPVFHSGPSRGSSPLSSIAYSAEASLVATGSSNGIISVYDTRAMNAPLLSFNRNGASVEDLIFLSSQDGAVGLAVATDDGLPYIADVRPEGPSVYAELVGTDCDAVRNIRVRPGSREVWTAGDDGIVRRYVI